MWGGTKLAGHRPIRSVDSTSQVGLGRQAVRGSICREYVRTARRERRDPFLKDEDDLRSIMLCTEESIRQARPLSGGPLTPPGSPISWRSRVGKEE